MSQFTILKASLRQVFIGTNYRLENEDFSGRDFKGKYFGERSYAASVLLALSFPAGYYLGSAATGFPVFDIIVPALISMLASYTGFLAAVYLAPRALPEAFFLALIESFFFVVLLSLLKKHFAIVPTTIVLGGYATGMLAHLHLILTPAFKRYAGRSLARNCEFIETNFMSSEWANAWIGSCDFTRAILESAKISKSAISNCRFNDSTLYGVKISETTIGGALFDNADASYASINASTIRDSSFTGCKLNFANFGNCKIENTTFRGARIGSVNFSNATFNGVDLTEAVANGETKWPKGFDPLSSNVILETVKVVSATSL